MASRACPCHGQSSAYPDAGGPLLAAAALHRADLGSADLPLLDFSASGTVSATHGLHAFAAKCPPALVRWAIDEYTEPGESVADGMVGSGTTVVEALLSGRRGFGFDIDPLARLISSAKSRVVDPSELVKRGQALVDRAEAAPDTGERPAGIDVNTWFRPEVQEDLARLVKVLGAEPADDIRDILTCLVSSLIVGRTSVANVRDIAHSRHHRRDWERDPETLARLRRRLIQARRMFEELNTDLPEHAHTASVGVARAERLPLGDESVSLYFSSPPYCSALDYTRAHIFAVAWLASLLDVTTEKYRELGRTYLGSERASLAEATSQQPLPPQLGIARVDSIVDEVAGSDRERAWIVHRYFRDMSRVLEDAKRVVREGGHIALVVCPSNVRRVFVPTNDIFIELADAVGGLELVLHQSRTIHDRRRVMPYLEEAFGPRMRTEYVIVWRRTTGRVLLDQQKSTRRRINRG